MFGLTNYSKKVIYVLLLFFGINNKLIAQKDSLKLRANNFKTISLGAYMTPLLLPGEEFFYFSNLNLNIGKHIVFGGINVSRSVTYSIYRTPNFWNEQKVKIGFNTGYKFDLFDRKKRVNLFIKYEFLYSGMNKALLVSHNYNNNNEQFDSFINKETYSLYNLIGVGAKFSIAPRMCIDLSINSGLGTDSEQISTDKYGTREFRYYYLAALIKFGFRYDFLYLK